MKDDIGFCGFKPSIDASNADSILIWEDECTQMVYRWNNLDFTGFPCSVAIRTAHSHGVS